MSLLARLQEDMKSAMKSGQKDRLSVLRMLISDVKNIDLQPKKISEEETVAAYGKKLRKSIEEYLPKKASLGDTEKLVHDFLSKNPFTEKQFGQAMGQFMKAHGPQVDPAQANALLKKKLAGK